MLQCSLREGFLEHVKNKGGISLVALLLDLPDLVILAIPRRSTPQCHLRP